MLCRMRWKGWRTRWGREGKGVVSRFGGLRWVDGLGACVLAIMGVVIS
jgi:hypothetical protein